MEGGLTEGLEVRLDASANVIKLHAKYGNPNKKLGRPEHYIDDTFRRRALA
jgi:hypothetical protein